MSFVPWLGNRLGRFRLEGINIIVAILWLKHSKICTYMIDWIIIPLEIWCHYLQVTKNISWSGVCCMIMIVTMICVYCMIDSWYGQYHFWIKQLTSISIHRYDGENYKYIKLYITRTNFKIWKSDVDEFVCDQIYPINIDVLLDIICDRTILISL